MNYFDTHSHIQFKSFDQDRDNVIKEATEAGVEAIIAVGTDLESSKKAIEVAKKYPSVFAAVGIHPHHVYSYLDSNSECVLDDKNVLEKLVNHPKVIAVGETGLDTYLYPNTKYENYQITTNFLELQERVFTQQINLAKKYQKTLIIHNRGADEKLLEILKKNWDIFLAGRSVFHCCEPSKKLLEFAKENHIFIGVDGDVTYNTAKQDFIKEVPLELLVLETDSPFFIPDPLKTQGITQNTPKNITLICDFLDIFLGSNVHKMSRNNSLALFKLAK